MDDNMKVILIAAPIVLPVAYLFLKLFITEAEFRKGIYIMIGCAAVFMGWISFIKSL